MIWKNAFRFTLDHCTPRVCGPICCFARSSLTTLFSWYFFFVLLSIFDHRRFSLFRLFILLYYLFYMSARELWPSFLVHPLAVQTVCGWSFSRSRVFWRVYFRFQSVRCMFISHDGHRKNKKRLGKNHECSNLMSFCFSIHILLLFFFLSTFWRRQIILCPRLMTFASELTCWIRNWMRCHVWAEFDWARPATQRVRSCDGVRVWFQTVVLQRKGSNDWHFGWQKMSCCATIDFEKTKNETKICGTWYRGATFDGDQHYSCVQYTNFVRPALCDASDGSESF